MDLPRTLPIRLAPLSGEPLDSWLAAYAHRLHATMGDLLAALALRRDGRQAPDYTAAYAPARPSKSRTLPVFGSSACTP